jgi:ArsR family transcriptional regulator, lead/cadmium/zinc/bismuth-responsive transcriptional repressor
VLLQTPIGGAVCDPAKPALAERPLLSPAQAAELMGLFKILASDSRLRLLHALARAGELCVSDLAANVAMSPQAVSNQLQRLVDRRIVAARRQGSNVYYRLVDPCAPGLLELGLCLAEDAGQLPQSAPVEAG